MSVPESSARSVEADLHHNTHVSLDHPHYEEVGSVVAPPPRQVAAASQLCVDCGVAGTAGDKFCDQCGSQLVAEPLVNHKLHAINRIYADVGKAGIKPAPRKTRDPSAPVTVSQPAPERHPLGDWREVKDPSSGKMYYYHARTKETRWDKHDIDPATGQEVVRGKLKLKAKARKSEAAAAASPGGEESPKKSPKRKKLVRIECYVNQSFGTHFASTWSCVSRGIGPEDHKPKWPLASTLGCLIVSPLERFRLNQKLACPSAIDPSEFRATRVSKYSVPS